MEADTIVGETKSPPRGWVAKKFLVVILLLSFCIQAGGSAVTKSATWDETGYLGIGKYLLTNFTWDIPGSILHPPLSYYINGLPFLFAHTDAAPWVYPHKEDGNMGFLGSMDYKRGQSLLSMPSNHNDRLLILSRCMTIAISLLLGYFVYRWGRDLFGWQGGFIALMFFAFCPNMIAHGSLITPDMTLTVFFFITVYWYREAFLKGRMADFLFAGISLGLALLSKFTALLLIPILMLLAAVLLLQKKRIPLLQLSLSLGIAAALVLLAYGFSIAPYIQGIYYQADVAQQHDAFLMGNHSSQGWWYYFLVAFLLKTPIPLILLILFAVVLQLKNAWSNSAFTQSLFLWVPPVTVFFFFSAHYKDIGLRYVLPAYPFVFVLASGAALQVAKKKYLLPILLVWYIASSVSVFPDYLTFFNEAAGGPDGGYQYLVDSNLDWGQDLKGLKNYIDKKGVKRISLSYFGTDLPERYGIRYDWLPSLHLNNKEPDRIPQIPSQQLLAISATNLQGVYFENKNIYKWLDQYRPVARIGHSIFIYDLYSNRDRQGAVNISPDANRTVPADALRPLYAQVYLERGIYYSENNQPLKAIDAYGVAVSLDPAYSYLARNNRSVLYRELFQYDRALSDLKAAIALQPDTVLAYCNRGLLLGSMGQSERALMDFNKAIALKPGYAEAYVGRGLLLINAGSVDRAVKDLTKAIEINPYNEDAYLNRGVAFERLHDLGRARQDYDRALELNPSDSLAYENRGIVFREAGRDDKAIEDFSRAIALKSNNARVYALRGEIYYKAGKLEFAAGDYRSACNLGNAGACELLNHISRDDK